MTRNRFFLAGILVITLIFVFQLIKLQLVQTPAYRKLAEENAARLHPLIAPRGIIYDRTGKNLLYEVVDESTGDRQWVKLDQIPQSCREATIANEDRSFYENAGFDLRGMGRALMSNLQGGQVQGGSSITQQVVKNTLIESEQRTVREGIEGYLRKLRETLLAVEVGRRYVNALKVQRKRR